MGIEAAKESGAVATAPAQYLTFSVGDEVFAMDIITVREIIQITSITTVPLMPDFVRGVINLRGAVLPVIDLKSRFGRGTALVGKRSCVVIFDSVRDGDKVELGLMVDSVSEVVEVPVSSIEPAPQFGNSIERSFIGGMGKVGGQFIVILDTERALDLEDMAQRVEHSQR